MDLESTSRISFMSFARRQRLAVVLSAALLVSAAFVAAGPAKGAVGVEKVSRLAGAPGEVVDLTLGCGFCFPPCHGAPGHRNAPCMLGTKAQPPVAFPVSLVPIEKAPGLHRCGPNALCPPHTSAPPGRGAFSLLGEATPPGGEIPEQPGAGFIPRYLLGFEIPDVPPGVYAYVVFCDVCMRGKAGSLIASPSSRLWRLRVRPAEAKAGTTAAGF